MQANLTREQALDLLKTYNQEPFHIQHALTVESVLRWYAQELGYQQDQDFFSGVWWGCSTTWILRNGLRSIVSKPNPF